LARSLAAVGLISYSLYLVHAPLIDFLEHAIWKSTNDGLASILLRYAVNVPASLAVALAFFLLVERRFLNRQPAREADDGARRASPS
jgi:peptidoglycan/LPS O-acetylase OafA/YrhL